MKRRHSLVPVACFPCTLFALVFLVGACASPAIGIGGDVDAAVQVPDLAEGDLDDTADLSTGDAAACPRGQSICGDVCADLQNDARSCGRCGAQCMTGQACIAGQCTCTPQSCVAGCCAGALCLPGTDKAACGANGIACTTCNTSCVNGGCSGCAPGASQTMPCGNCGTMTRLCDQNGVWGQFDACQNQGVCTPNQTRSTACGNCGTAVETCDNTCQWSTGACQNQGACMPGMTRSAKCGNCGTQTDTCNNSCQWAVGSCAGQGCVPGTTQTKGCGNCGTQTDTCNNNCQWSAGGCAGQGACAPGSTRAGGCDGCSQQTCGNNCQWGGCGLKPGNACEWQSGLNKRNCTCKGGCSGSAYQWCLNSCQWSTQCSCCAPGCNAC